jgi:hypothetical protein
VSPRTDRHSESFETRVLAALAAGATTPEEIAAGLTVPLDQVHQTLAQAVDAGVVASAGGAPYSLTPKGRAALGLSTTIPGDPPPVTQAETQTPPPTPSPGQSEPLDLPAAHPGLTKDPVGALAQPRVRWRHVVYAGAYVVFGVLLLLLQPVVGVVLIVAGLALGGFALRPLFTTRTSD